MTMRRKMPALIAILMLCCLLSACGQEEYASTPEAEAIMQAMTVDYDAEQFAHTEADIFVAVLAGHFEQVYILSHWNEQLSVEELELELDDSLYGQGKARFKGVSLAQIFKASQVEIGNGIVTVYNRQSTGYKFTEADITEQGLYIMAYCEGRLFGFPADGGTGPLVLMSVHEGKAEIISTNVVNITHKERIENPSSDK